MLYFYSAQAVSYDIEPQAFRMRKMALISVIWLSCLIHLPHHPFSLSLSLSLCVYLKKEIQKVPRENGDFPLLSTQDNR